jgi:hypothetical protein
MESAAEPQAPHVVDGEEVQATQLLLTARDSDCPFTEEQLAAFGGFLERGSVQKSTQVTYRQGWALWKKFLPQLPLAQRPCNYYLDNVRGDINRALYVLAFGKHLYETRNWRGRQVTRNFAHLRHHFHTGVRDTLFLDHPLLDKTRDAMQMSHPERQADVLRRIKESLLPMTYPMLDLARESYWVATSWDTDQGRDRKVAFLATGLLIDTGNRVSSTTGPTTDKELGVTTDHGLKTAQVEITVRRPAAKTTFTLAGAPAMRSHLCRATVALRYPQVESMRVTFLTQKVVMDGKGTPDPLFFGRRDPRESQYLDDVLEWVSRNGKLLDGDYLTTRYQLAPKPAAKMDKRLLQRQDVAAMIKAIAVEFDLDPKRFSTSSARRFAGSTNALSMAEIKLRGAWAASSTVTEQHYRRDPEGRGAFAVAGAGGEFTHQQLVGLTRTPLDTCPTLSDDEEVADNDPYDLDGVDEWVRGEDTGEDGGQEDMPETLCESGTSASAPPPVDIPVAGAGRKRELPASMRAPMQLRKRGAGQAP